MIYLMRNGVVLMQTTMPVIFLQPGPATPKASRHIDAGIVPPASSNPVYSANMQTHTMILSVNRRISNLPSDMDRINGKHGAVASFISPQIGQTGSSTQQYTAWPMKLSKTSKFHILIIGPAGDGHCGREGGARFRRL